MKLKLIKVAGLILLGGIYPEFGLSQVRVEGIPESFKSNEKSAVIIPATTLDSIFPEMLLIEDIQLGITNRYGTVQTLATDLKSAAISTNINGQGTIWRYELKAPDAISIGIQFSKFHLPPDASLYIYNLTKTKVLGAFTALNNKEDGYFAVSDFKGNELVIEYYEPDSVEFPGEVVLGDITLAYKDLSESASSSQIYINCPAGDDWQLEKNSVCLITFIEGRYSYVCTGSLLNNVRGDSTPYFLTANHCISSNTVAKTVITYFNYENQTCTSDDAPLDHTLSGATLKANGSTSDFSLLLLSEQPTDEYTPYFAGWDATGDKPTSGACIHHPDSKPKSIAIENDAVTGNTEQILWDDNSVSKVDSHWDVYFDTGVTESGSSGSPFFNEDKRVVGQLHGGSDEESLYGKFSISWESNSTASKQLKAWLDPDNTGVKVLDGSGGKIAPKASFATQMALACTNNPVLLTDKSWYSPTKWLWRITPDSYQFVENTDSTSQNPVVEFLEEKKYTIELIASNNFGSDSLIETNSIDVRETLPVQFLWMSADTTVCGCDVSSLLLIGSGAYNYNFSLSDSNYLSATVQSDTLSLSLNSNALGKGAFNTWIKIEGSHGSCMASDSLFLQIIQQENDNIADAIQLDLGRNAYYSNHCGTIESYEPSPRSGNCYSQLSWCSGESGSNLNNSVWFSFYAPTNGVITIDTHGFDDQLAVYQSLSGSETISSFDDLDELAANDDRSSSDETALISELAVEPGKKYWIQLDGRYGAYGNAILDLISNSAEVYPTVSTDGLFTLYVSSSEEGTADFAVYNVIGQRVLEGSTAVTLDNDYSTLNLNFCPKGVYLLSVKMGSISSTHKIVIQ